MAKYLLLKHYRGAPSAVNDVPMDQWTPEEVEAHVQFMSDFAGRLGRDRVAVFRRSARRAARSAPPFGACSH